MKLAICVGLFAALLATGASAKTPMRCDVKMDSMMGGGSIEVTTSDPAPQPVVSFPPLKVLWEPPALDGDDIELFVGYRDASLKAFGAADGARAKFAPGIGSRIDQFQAIVRAGDVELGRFRPDPDFGAEQGDFIFSEDDAGSKAVMVAINAGKPIAITILKDGVPAASVTFNTSATPARDDLLTQSAHLIETSSAQVCNAL